mgnify:CR=1 FL=1
MDLAKLKDMIAELVKAALGEERAKMLAEMQAQTRASDIGAAIAKAAGAGAPQPSDKTLVVGRLVRALAATRGDAEKALRFAKEAWKDTATVEVFEKALAAGSATAGGFLVPVEYSTEIISFLRARAVVRSFNPTMLPMANGTISIPKISGGAAAGYVGENQNIGKTEQQFGQLVLTAKKLAALTPISNDLIRFASPSADTLVRNDLISAMAVREDLAFIRGDGTQNTPKGLRNWIPSGNVISANGTVNLANVTQDLGKLLLALKAGNAPMINVGWIMAPRTEIYLMTLLTANGVYAFREEMLTGKLWGLPYKTTTQVPTNLGAGSDSELYIADFNDVVIAEAEQLVLDVSTEAAYYDGSAVVAAFSQDQTVVRALAMHDIGVRHPESVAVLSGVTWQ